MLEKFGTEFDVKSSGRPLVAVAVVLTTLPSVGCGSRIVETGAISHGNDVALDRGAPGPREHDGGESAFDGPWNAPDQSGDAGNHEAGDDDGLWDSGPDAGPDVFVRDMCTGARPDGGVMDVTPSCRPSPTGRGGEMCRVPGGPFWMGIGRWDCPGAPCIALEPIHQVFVSAFEMDRYEVSVREYAECVSAGVCASPTCYRPDYEAPTPNSDLPGHEEHPVNCVDWYQASTYCAWAGKRLPSEAEWEKAARGTDGRRYPSGNEPPDCDQAVYAGAGCGVDGTWPIGSKPAGASPYGIEDLAGNIEEWTTDEGYVYSYYSAPADGRSYVTNMWFGRGFRPFVIRGGHWSYLEGGGLDSTYRNPAFAEEGYDFVGFRCILSGDERSPPRGGGRGDGANPPEPGAGASIFGENHAEPDTVDPDAASSLACGISPTGRGGEMCDVPEGLFPMGCRENTHKNCDLAADDFPLHEVWLSAFKIDKFEVTAGEYRACVEAGGCGLPGNINFVCNERCTYAAEGRENHPINCVLWEQGRDYCAWVGKRLPTEAEWEKSAGGPDGLFWPWTDDLEGGTEDRVCPYVVSLECFSEYAKPGVEPAGTKPLGASPYGALDMVGNVWEWTADWYDEYYYANSPSIDPPGPPGGYAHVLRGGSFNYPGYIPDNKTRYAVFHPAYWSETVGFRCAY